MHSQFLMVTPRGRCIRPSHRMTGFPSFPRRDSVSSDVVCFAMELEIRNYGSYVPAKLKDRGSNSKFHVGFTQAPFDLLGYVLKLPSLQTIDLSLPSMKHGALRSWEKKKDSCSIVLQAKVAASGSSLTYITHHRIMSSPLGFVRGTRHLPRNISRYTTSQWVVFPKYTLVARIISMGTEGVSPFSLKSATCTATCSPHGPLTRPTQTAAPPER